MPGQGNESTRVDGSIVMVLLSKSIMTPPRVRHLRNDALEPLADGGGGGGGALSAPTEQWSVAAW